MKTERRWDVLVNEFVATKAARKDKKTTDWYRARLKHWQHFATDRRLKPKKVRSLELDIFFGQLKAAGYKYNTREGTATALKAFFGWLRKHHFIKKNPFEHFEPLEKERDVIDPIPLSFAYRMIRRAEADRSPYGIRDAAMMRFLLTTGARREELAGLELAALNLEQGQALLIGKFNHRRRVPLQPTTITALRRWLDIRPDGGQSGALFITLHPTNRGLYHELRPDAINDMLLKWRRKAGLPETLSVSPHKWRHRFATELKKAGDPFSLQLLLGHTDISTTNRYVHSSPEELRDLVLRFGPDCPLGE